MRRYENMTLLVDGKRAFPVILSAIAEAKETLFINMFIWRDDAIGNKMAEAVLSAAERGVKVRLSLDRYGLVLEKAEEAGRSFFHKKATLTEKIKIAALMLLYRRNHTGWHKDEATPLYEKLLSHPNVTLEKDRFKADHSKFYVIDGKTLFFGGVNIEDKENGCDLLGREYGDYMVKIDGREAVTAFFKKLENGEDGEEDYTFGVNTKPPLFPLFEMEEKYLALIRGAEKELFITMAYFSPLPHFLDALTDAVKRGVKLTVMIPERANFQDDTNKKTVKRLMKRTGGAITLLLSPRMLHTKLVMNEKNISFGSCNITKKAFHQLSELNLCLENTDSALRDALLANETALRAEARRVASYKELRYHRLLATLEGFLV
ncbi:MAG: phosphatidylserine/phosphatidylglycerophosphate/cardiolipin synthase family protein [Clostridia bacterium]|nr:phosphatidylserine/phosphatidylglycerophosphate/cardiolipin synthase family protein [Clostridia bacterium]